MAPRGTNRARLLLVSLLVTSLLLITLDLRGANVVAVRSATQTVLSPFQSAGSAILSPIGNFFSDLFNLGNTRERIEELERENEKLKSEVILNQNLEGELAQLKGVLDLAGKARFKTERPGRKQGRNLNI